MFDWDSQKDFLNVNAAVERCTSDMLFQPDYEQNLALVDKLQESPKLMDTYLSAIRRRMQNPSEEIVLSLSVTLLETILKNCHGAIEIWGRRENQEAVVQICVTTKHLRAREPLLELVQELGIAYKDDKKLVFEQAYKELMGRHKISFPPPSKQPFVGPSPKTSGRSSPAAKAPQMQDLHKSSRRTHEIDIFDPTGLLGDESDGQYEQLRSAPRSSSKSSSKSTAKNQSIEDQLDSVSSTLGLLNDILDALGPNDRVQDNELIGTILPAVQSLHENIMRVLQGDMSSLDETLTARLFSANDSISEALDKYDRAKKGILPTKRRTSPAPTAPAKPPSSTLPRQDDNEFQDEFDILATRKRPQVKSMSSAASLGPASINPFMAPPQPTGSPINPFLSPTLPPASDSKPAFGPMDLLSGLPVSGTQKPPTAPSILQPTFTPPYSGSDSLI